MKVNENKIQPNTDLNESLRSKIKDIILNKRTVGKVTEALVNLFNYELAKEKKGLPE